MKSISLIFCIICVFSKQIVCETDCDYSFNTVQKLHDRMVDFMKKFGVDVTDGTQRMLKYWRYNADSAERGDAVEITFETDRMAENYLNVNSEMTIPNSGYLKTPTLDVTYEKTSNGYRFKETKTFMTTFDIPVKSFDTVLDQSIKAEYNHRMMFNEIVSFRRRMHRMRKLIDQEYPELVNYYHHIYEDTYSIDFQSLDENLNQRSDGTTIFGKYKCGLLSQKFDIINEKIILTGEPGDD